jgi:hypothetical protein
MRKPLLLCSVLLVAAVSSGAIAKGATMRIGISPIPPNVGTVVTFTAGPNMKIKVEVSPNGVWDLTTDANGNVDWTVPPGAAAIIVSDPNGTWTSNSTVVQ